MTQKEKRKFLTRYTGLFFAAAFATWFWLLAHGETMIEKYDSFNQHYRALMYYGQWMRSIVKTFLTEGRLTFPEWDFSIGYGANTLTTMHYYAIGDPLNLLSVFVPARYTLYLYCFLVVLRNYLAGLSFSVFCFYMKRRNQTAVIAGAFTYAFCLFSIVMGTRHPFFVNPMIYFPLVLLGTEKVLKKESPYMLIGAVFLSAMSNFYFFYMIALLTAVYALVRTAVLYGLKGWRNAARALLRITFFALTGVLLSAALLLPVVLWFLQDYRTDASYPLSLFFGANYYKSLLAAFTSATFVSHQAYLGTGAASLLAAALLFLRKDSKRRTQKILLVTATLFLLIPAAAYVLNGCSYVVHRWIWAYSFLAAFVLTDMWEGLFELRKREWLALAAGTAVYLWLCRAYPMMIGSAFLLAAMLAVLALCAARRGKAHTGAQNFMLALVFAGIFWNALCEFPSAGNNRANGLQTVSGVRELEQQNPDAVMTAIRQTDSVFWRYTGKGLQRNSSVNNRTNNTQYYWSLSNGNLARFFVETETLTKRLYLYTDLDDRALLSELLGARYYVCPSGQEPCVPYGYEFLKEDSGWAVYKSENALPLAFTYDSCVTEAEVSDLNSIQKQTAMAQSVILEEEAEGIETGTPRQDGEELIFSVAGSDGVELTENKFIVSEKNGTVSLQVSGAGAAELYVCLSGFSYEGEKETLEMTASVLRSDGTQVEKTLTYYASGSDRPTQTDHFTWNLGYSESSAQLVTFTFSCKGDYQYDELCVYSQPVEHYEEYLKERAADAWEDEKIDTDLVQGKVDLDEDKLLFLSIPYDGGWTAYVDGEKTEVLKANYAFTALKVPAGEHTVTLVYHTPGLRLGLLLSAAGALLLAGIAAWRRRRNNGYPAKTDSL